MISDLELKLLNKALLSMQNANYFLSEAEEALVDVDFISTADMIEEFQLKLSESMRVLYNVVETKNYDES